MAAAAAFLERSLRLTADPARLVERTLAAAQACSRGGAFDTALGLLVMAEAQPMDELQSARVDLLRGQMAFPKGAGRGAAPLLLNAARRLESHDLGLARETYLEAWTVAFSAGPLAASDLADISHAALALPGSPRPGPLELLLDGLAQMTANGLAAAAATLRQAVGLFSGDSVSVGDRLRWSYVALWPAVMLWDDEGYRAILARQLQLIRSAGALDRLPIDLRSARLLAAWSGDFGSAAALIAEAEAVCEVTGAYVPPPYATFLVAGLRGNEAEVVALIEATSYPADARWQMDTITLWITAILHNGLGRYGPAREEARQAAEDASFQGWPLSELTEAAVRSGNMPMAVDAVARLTESTQIGGTDLALGLEARARALVTEDSSADGFYREAIERLGRTQLRTELARSHLLYGEWLRRQAHRSKAREPLRTAHDLLSAIGMEAFAERARRELAATGETARKRSAPAGAVASPKLTAQEAQVAALARDGLSNPEIGARLFISTHTVQCHLSKVFAKLGITARGQLQHVLPGSPAVRAI